MKKFTCNKLRRGSLDYNIDNEKKCINLEADYPAKGQKGASFDNKPILFSDINQVLKKKKNIKSKDFTDCFSVYSGNNCSMLVAVLLDLGILKKQNSDFVVQGYL